MNPSSSNRPRTPAPPIYQYGSQMIPFTATANGETLSAYIQGADGDESATIQRDSVQN